MAAKKKSSSEKVQSKSKSQYNFKNNTDKIKFALEVIKDNHLLNRSNFKKLEQNANLILNP